MQDFPISNSYADYLKRGWFSTWPDHRFGFAVNPITSSMPFATSSNKPS